MPHPPLIETNCPGRRSTLRRLTQETCPALALHHLEHIGVGEAAADFCMVRTNLPGAFLIATVGGGGWVRLDGRWRRCEAGWVCLSPPHVVQGCHAEAGSRWRFLWCRWESDSTPALLTRPDTPLMRKFDAAALHHIISALCCETASHGHSTVVHHLIDARI
ncbi:MAG: AraC family ligand binding domain-containing protein, partial [Verrucomicrobiota bacterium]